jgi:hypothetical protein
MNGIGEWAKSCTASTTHVVTDGSWDPALTQYTTAINHILVVRSKWIFDCIKDKTLINEAPYILETPNR